MHNAHQDHLHRRVKRKEFQKHPFKMDYPKEVQEKLAHLRSYVPFVQRMISKLEMRSQQVGASHGQLERLHGLHGFLTNPIPRAPRMEMLEKMEAVIRSMQDKVHRAQGKPPESSLNMESVRSSGSNSPGAVNPRFSQDPSHSRAGSSSSDPRASSKHSMGSSREFISGNRGMDSGKILTGQTPSPARTHQHSPAARSGSLDWQSKKDFSGRGEKRREGQSERPRESNYDRNRRESDRSDGRHSERSMDRGSDRSREREYERSRSKEYERRRDSDSHRSWEKERSSDRESKLRVSNEKESERRRESSKDKEHERDKSRDFVRTSISQERSEYGKDRDFRHGIQDGSSSDKDRRHVEGRSIGEQEKKQGDGKTSKWSSLLDLPMPPPSLSQDAQFPASESRSASAANYEKFQNSREKLQRLFGIYGESSGTKEKEGNTSKARGWREEVRARKDQFFSQRSVQGSGDIDERVESHSQRHKMQQQKEPTFGTSHQNAPKTHNLQGNEPRENLGRCKSVSFNRNTNINPEQPNDNLEPSRDTPLSPDQSPVNQFDATDTPMSPDAEGTFSPVVSTEDTTPIKTIPLENIQQKGVDLEAIKKALARIQESERKSEASTSSNQGPSYRYEDFVGPASTSKPDEEEPYDPEEVWNNQNFKAPVSDKSAPSVRPPTGDTDLRSMPKTMTSLPQSYQGKMLDKKDDFPGSTLYSKGEIQSHNSGPPRSGAPANISPQRQASFESQRTSNQSIVSDHTGAPGTAWYQSGSVPRPSSSGDVDMRFHQSKPSLPRHKTIIPKTQEPSVHKLQSQAAPLQPPPLPPSSTLPQRSSLNRPPEDSSDRETHNYSGSSRLDSVRSRIAHKSGEFIKPGQQGVAASQMEKYKLKKQSSISESKSPSSLNTSTKLDSGSKSKDSVSVLDLLLPESSEAKAEECSTSFRDPRQINQIPRDPRLKPPDPSETDTLTGAVHARDPRLSSGGGLSRDPRHQTNRDPRQDISKFSSTLHREDLSRHFGASSSVKRDPRQDLGIVSHGAAQVRDPRQDMLSARGGRDIRQEGVQFPQMTPNQHRDPRDPRVVPRGDRSTPVWPLQPPPVPTPSYAVQAPSVTTDPSPSQSASGSLIGQTFTCLMMRGLPPFTNSNHIYHFFQEYILRDISIELDNHFQCKGTAYIHFPSHSSAREALELMNGHSLQGSPISLRICTVGILRQAKNAYENLNREREARLGIPERPRGNGNPFFKPRSKEPVNKPPSKSVTGLSGKLGDKPELASNKTQGPVEGNETGGTGQYSELCGVKVPPKAVAAKSSFKIPKIKKDEPKQKDDTKGDNTSTEIQENKTKTLVTKPSKESSESEDDLQSVKAKNTKNRKFKKIVIASDSESGDDEPERSGSKRKKTPGQVAINRKGSTEVESKSVCGRDAVTHDEDAKSKSVIDSDAVSAGNDGSDDDDDADDDEGYMVIDETVLLSDTEESEVSSQMSEEPLEHTSASKEPRKKSKNSKTKRKSSGKQKPVKKSVSLKGKKKLQNNSSSGKKVRGKKISDKYMLDNAYKPELQLNTSVGLKLTRHTQGELEELIPEQKKLKVLIPVPHKIVTTICEDEKIKKKGGRQKTVENVQSVDILKISPVSKPKEAVQALPVKERIKLDSDKKSDGDNVILPIDGYWEYTAKYGPVGEMFLPVNTKLVVTLRKEVAVGTPTARKGKKRKISPKAQRNTPKKQRSGILGPSRNQQRDLSDVDKSEAHGVLSTDTNEPCKGAEKRSPLTPLEGNDSKRLCLEMEKHSTKSEGTSHFDLFETSILPDDQDLTQITPSLLDVDPTISIALPNASALASVLSPPRVSHSTTETIHHKVEADCIWPTDKQSSDEKFYDVTKTLQTANVKDLGENVMEEDSVLEEMINIAIKTADTEESRRASDNKDQEQEECKGGTLGTESSGIRKGNINKHSEVNIEDAELSKTVNEYKIPLERNTGKEKVKDNSNVKKETSKESGTSDAPVESPSEEKLLLVKVEKDASDKMSSSVSDFGNSSLKQVSDSRKSCDHTFKISSEEALISETVSCKAEISDTEAVTKLNKNFGVGTVTQEDTDDDVVSIGKVSTSSFVDDASVVSSEGRDVKTPESQPPKRGRKNKNQINLPSVECRRVTRGSVVEPLTAEHVEWDDGGIVDLFQCDQCDYVGRHIAHHLVNFHTDRELPCEFKKEDFPPVIKDYVGPPQESIKEAVHLDLSWIPNYMTFDENITCKECDYCSKNRFDLIYHYLEHIPQAASNVYHCRLCNYMCEKKENFYNHVSSHTGEYRFRCELCGHFTYKKDLLEAHHKDNHKSQPESFFEAPMTEDNGWLYIYVCKVCMFVRINLAGAENHVQQKHGGKADIHKANMSRPIILHSELRKPGSESDSALLRPKYKGKKRKKGKKLPDLEVFIGEQEDDEKETEEKAKQLVDRISSNIHTTMSVEDAKKRMSLLNSISKKLDEETEEDSIEQEFKSKHEEASLEPQPKSEQKEEPSTEPESKQRQEEPSVDTAPSQTLEIGNESNSAKGEIDVDDVTEIKRNVEEESHKISDGKGTRDNLRGLRDSENTSTDSDSESTISAVEPDAFGDDLIISGNGLLQETIRKLSAKLEECVKEKKVIQQSEESKSIKETKKQKITSQGAASSTTHDNDSDSDTLVICEDADSEKEGEEKLSDLSQTDHCSKESTSDAESAGKSSLQDSIQSILREASTQDQNILPMPKLRIRPAHQLIEPHVTSKLNFLVCPFHCKNVFIHFVELIDHLTACHSQQFKDQDQPDEDSEIPGFLKIESVSTLDPAAASQMFGDANYFFPDYASTSGESTSLLIQSPTKSPRSSPQGTAVASPQKITLSSPQGTTITTPQGTPICSPQGITISIPPRITKSPDTSQLFTTVVSPTSSERIVTVTSPTPAQSIASANSTGLSFLPVSTTTRATTTTTTVADSLTSTTATSKKSEGIESSLLLTSEKASQPSIVTIDEEEGREQKEHPPPPGMATLPKSPPTVPVQFIFQIYQTAHVFKTLITKLAPEVFKCMHNGCVFAEDDAEAFINHITEHGCEYRCCYCLVLMATPEHLVQHVITEHSHCQFQCKYCLYRAFTKIYMGVHLKNFHPRDEPRYIKVETIQSHPPPNPPIDQFVRPYKCTYQDCQYRTVDAEAFKTHVNSHGSFVILSCDFCHKHLHVIPLIDHMREHQMNEYQCPYCLHGDAEKERLLSHLLNCHSGRPGKVLLRKQITSSVSSAAPCPEMLSPLPQQPPPSSSAITENDSNCDGLNFSKDSVDDKPDEEIKPVSQANMKSLPKVGPGPGRRRPSRNSSTELDNAKGNEENSNWNPSTAGDDSFLQATEKTGLSGHALYRCGNDGCEYSSLSQVELREHLQICDLAQDSTVVRCYHCGKQCRHLSTLLDHLRVHGPKRYFCGVTGCDYRATMVHYFKNHMKQIHKCSGFKQLLKDSKNKDPESQEYVVYPKDSIPAAREGHRKRKNEYGIDNIHRIPRAHVSYQELKCYHCPFVSKVRLNLIKHIRLHEKYPDGIPQRLNIACGSNSAIPFKQPVNPVPCLERKELMFDKMMNLAGSSFETKKKKEDSDLRAKNPIPPEEYQRLPKYVPEERLYTCGIEGCNYLSCDDMMLKYHIRTLHADATTFPCPHCIDMSITVEKMSSHFKLHGERLYRCGWCQYISSRRNVVERHMKEKHHSKKPFDYVIREPEDPDAQKKSDEKPPEEPAVNIPQPTQDPQWQCGLCKFSSVTQQEMLNHTSLKHSIKSQFKCGYCSVRSSVRTSFDAHFAAKHPTQQFRVLCMYYRLDSEDIEPLNHGDAQHMHEPLWKRNDPERIRHIRGILIDDDPEIKKNWFRQTSTGKPDRGEFVCPKCGSFKTACVSTFRSHLCREASYARYQCGECGVSNALLPSLQRHYTKMHHAPFTSVSYLQLPVEEEKEAWVESVISHQEDLIKRWHERGGSEVSVETSLSQEKAVISSRRSSTNASSHSLSGDTTQEQGGIVLHDSGSERGRYTCDTCGSECRSAAGLKSHTTAMHQARFKCHYCPFASNSEDAVKQHSSVKHPKLQSEVLDVSQRIKVQRGDSGASEDITSPEKNKEDQGLERTVSPSMESSLVSQLDQSCVNSEDNSDFTLESDITDSFSDNLEDSQSLLAKIYSCPFCSFTTSTTSRLNHHNRSKHSETRLYMCMYCKGRFNTTMDALRHHKWKHMPQKPKIIHMTYNKVEENFVKEQVEVGFSENSEVLLSSKSNTLPKLMLEPKPGRSKAKKSFTKSSSFSHVKGSSTSGPSSSLSVESTFTCCHCSHQSSKVGMEEHMKKQHRDLPYQVRREEKDRIFTEVHIYKCIHCVVESISLAQAMDHWIQNHPLLDFKFDLVLRHSGEVSNQVVSSTTVDKDLAHEVMDTGNNANLDDADMSIAGIDRGTINSSAIPSCSDITSSSESSNSKPMPISRQRESKKDTPSSRSSVDAEEEEIIDLSEILGSKESEIQSRTEAEKDVVYKCGLCKKSSDKLHELQAHIKKIHPERDVKIKKLSREVFEQLFRAEYKCDYCGERGRHKPISRHHKVSHPGLPMKVSRIPQPSRENVYFRCDVCGHVVKNLQSIRQHIRRHHPGTDDFTFSKLTLGSPMRPPVKQPFKCNYCGDVGETLEEMHTHHAFLHSHLECSITNLMDEALSSLHSPSTSHSVEDSKISSSIVRPMGSKSSLTVSTAISEVSKEPENTVEDSKSAIESPSAVPLVSQCKNTARKSFPTLMKRAVAMKSTSKPQVVEECDDTEEFSAYHITQPPLELENVYAFVNLGAGVPMRLTVQQLGRLVDLKPQVVVTDVSNEQEN
ncbi:uncharacterized protein LOC126997343 isoform X4 [Eriocheir sinensis]|uniref:uncharacterized protein LOC126997343 isoform X4 n=1 Tax=Eriocheir sinensis TaxID=95602 RepID=UPI0021C79D6D|nr:uncharacterized protein LOC126997343 isoform X4 [Eriocheir sinensis]